MPPHTPIRYLTDLEDSARWLDFPIRPGDIVISTRSKSGTTWMQMICALLVFQNPNLPAPLSELSPWLDYLITPWDGVAALLAAQRHRRFIKTHTPLNGIPLHPHVTYIVVARHPLDVAVSLYYQDLNIDFDRVREITGGAHDPHREIPATVDASVRAWISQDIDPHERLDSLPGVMMHLSDAWNRRADSNIILFHYDDLARDLEGEMRRLAAKLAIEVPADRWPVLAEAATFAQMSRRADELAPALDGTFKSTQAFFRAGRSGTGRELLNADELAAYHARVAGMAPPDLLAWLHHDG